MKRFHCLCFALIILCFSTGSLQSQTNSTKPIESLDTKHGLQLSVKLDKQEYHLKEDARVTLKLTNVGDKSIAIFKDFGWGVRSSLSFYLIKKGQGALQQDFLDDAADYSPFPREKFTLLNPNESTETGRFFGIDDSNGIVVAGTYQVVIWYHSPVSKKDAPDGMDVWLAEYGDLKAIAEFNVVQ